MSGHRLEHRLQEDALQAGQPIRRRHGRSDTPGRGGSLLPSGGTRSVSLGRGSGTGTGTTLWPSLVAAPRVSLCRAGPLWAAERVDRTHPQRGP